MKKQFKVGKIAYEVNFQANEFEFYIDSKKSDNALWVEKGSLDYKFGDVGPEHVYGLFPAENPMAVFKNVLMFVESVIKNKKPYYFFFEANSVEKESLYEKVAERIAKKHGYVVCEEVGLHKKFSFYKK